MDHTGLRVCLAGAGNPDGSIFDFNPDRFTHKPLKFDDKTNLMFKTERLMRVVMVLVFRGM